MPANLEKDFDLVAEEIIRFAGSAYIPTRIHNWAMQLPESYKILSERGVKNLCGYFVKNNGNPLWNGAYDVNYCLDDKRSRFLAKHKALKDFESGLTFCSLDLLFNATDISQIKPNLEKIIENPKKKGNVTLSTHEQYFWPQYIAPSSWFDADASGAMIYRHIPNHFKELK